MKLKVYIRTTFHNVNNIFQRNLYEVKYMQSYWGTWWKATVYWHISVTLSRAHFHENQLNGSRAAICWTHFDSDEFCPHGHLLSLKIYFSTFPFASMSHNFITILLLRVSGSNFVGTLHLPIAILSPTLIFLWFLEILSEVVQTTDIVTYAFTYRWESRKIRDVLQVFFQRKQLLRSEEEKCWTLAGVIQACTTLTQTFATSLSYIQQFVRTWAM